MRNLNLNGLREVITSRVVTFANILLANGTNACLTIRSILPSVPTAIIKAINFDITSNGSAAFEQRAVSTTFNAGYTGAQVTIANYALNFVAGTGTDYGGSRVGNFGVYGISFANSTGVNIGVVGLGFNGSTGPSIGVLGLANLSSSAQQIAVMGLARTQVLNTGGYFGLIAGTPPSIPDAALVANNGGSLSPILICQDHEVNKFIIDDGGDLWAANTKNLTESTATLFATIVVPSGSSFGGVLDYTIEANDGTDFQSRSGSLVFAAVNKAGTLTMTIGTPDGASEVVAVSAGTLTNAFTLVDGGGGSLQFKANSVSSLTQTTLRINYFIRQTSNILRTFTPA